DFVLANFLYARQPWLERFPSFDPGIRLVAGEHAAQRIIRERPLAGVEAKSLIDKRRSVLTFATLAPKRRLASIRVACPLIERQHSCEGVDISQSVEQLNWQ